MSQLHHGSAGLAAEYERLSRVGAALQGGLEDIQVTVDSADGMVTVVAGGRGEVLGLELDPRIYHSPDADALAKTIIETIRVAYAEATNESWHLLEKLKDDCDARMRPLFEHVQDAWDTDQGRR